MRRLVIAAALATTAILVFAGQAAATPSDRYGIQDDAWLRWGPAPFTGTLESRLDTLDTLGVRLVRFTLVWREVAPTEPTSPTDPNDPAYNWHSFDPVMKGLHAHHITVLVTIWGSPGWANGGRGQNFMPTSGYGNFAYAAARRYPWVRLWTAWNEPNLHRFAAPVSPANYVRHVLNPAWAALHRANRANRIAGGVTSPRRTPSGMAPVAFAEGMRRAHARLDAYAANPHPVSRNETPFLDPCRNCQTLTMARLGKIRRLVTRLWGARMPLWLTEYAYETNPPDRARGIPWARQALFVGQSALRVWQQPGTTMLIWFLVRDEPTLIGWQSGLFTAAGVPKPARAAFALPLAQISRTRTRTVLWGQVRPGSGRRAVRDPACARRALGERRRHEAHRGRRNVPRHPEPRARRQGAPEVAAGSVVEPGDGRHLSLRASAGASSGDRDLRRRGRFDLRDAGVRTDEAAYADRPPEVPAFGPSEPTAVLLPDHDGHPAEARIVHTEVEERGGAVAGPGVPRACDVAADRRDAAHGTARVRPADRAATAS